MKVLTTKHLILFTGILIYASLGLLAILYYIERTIFADVAFHLFYILKDCKLAIQVNRFGAAFTQVFPLICAKLHLPLEVTLMVYSEAFIIYSALTFLLCFLIAKEKSFAAVVMLFSIFMVTETFYWIQSELLQGIVFTVLFFAFLSRIKSSADVTGGFAGVYVLMIFFILFFHPLLIFVFVFFALFMLIDLRFVGAHKFIWASLVVVVIMTEIKNKLMLVPEYDSNAMETTQKIRSLFPHYLYLVSNLNFFKDLYSKFYLLPLVLLVITIFYLKYQQYKKLVLCYAFVFGYVALINITHDQGGFGFYMESLYLPISIFVIVPLMFDVMPHFTFPLQFSGLIFIFLTRIVSIQQAHIPFSQRIELEKNFLAKTENLPQKKLLIDEKDTPLDTLKMSWGTPYEFWLLSTIDLHETRSIVITDNPSSLEWALEKNKSFITKWGVFDYSGLPAQYFSLNDTSFYTLYHPYQ